MRACLRAMLLMVPVIGLMTGCVAEVKPGPSAPSRIDVEVTPPRKSVDVDVNVTPPRTGPDIDVNVTPKNP